MTEFSIGIQGWEAPIHGSPEVAQTAAKLAIVVDDQYATRADDDWSRSTRNDVLLSAYPLALWFAGSWWRLRWESASTRGRTLSWRMAHELPAAGHGFLWPGLSFASDGEYVEVTCNPSDPRSREPIRYLARFQTAISAKTFERAIDEFVDLVIARLDGSDSDLKSVWRSVLDERRDPTTSYHRQLEARLGFDPQEAPHALVDRLLALETDTGRNALLEVASGVAGRDPLPSIGKVLALADSSGVNGEIDLPRLLAQELNLLRRELVPPWELGYRLARLARNAWNLDGDVVRSSALANILHVSERAIEEPLARTERDVPFGLAIRQDETSRLRLVFRKAREDSRRFEAARFLADWLLRHDGDRWFPETDATTARQKAQRAFAAEFLCPIELLTAFLNHDFSEDAVERASIHFGISTWAVQHQLVNRGPGDRDANEAG
jgi:hypothetical protein